MISAGDFKNGLTLEIDGQVMQIVEFQHVKPGKGAAFVRTKMRNVINGGVVEKTFRPTEKFPAARIDRKDQEYLYNDGDLYYFMDPETYDQIMINADVIGDAMKFVKPNDVVKVCSYNGNVFSVEPPLFVELEVTDTEPGFAGNTAQGATKPATVETGATIQVPLFVSIGDVIKIDNRIVKVHVIKTQERKLTSGFAKAGVIKRVYSKPVRFNNYDYDLTSNIYKKT